MLARLLRLGACLAASLALWAAPAAAQQSYYPPTLPTDPNVPSVERYLARCLTVPTLSDSYWNATVKNRMIAGLIRTKASMVGGIFGYWDQPAMYNPTIENMPDYACSPGPCCDANNEPGVGCVNWNRYALRDLKGLVEDINLAYDRANLPRPILQASIFEHISPSEVRPDSSITDGVHNITIPQDLLELFRDEITLLPPSERSRYMAVGQEDMVHIPMRTNVKFDFELIAFNYGREANGRIWWSPDAHRIEGRLWLCYEAKCLIDRGITSLHMGQPAIWGHLYDANGDAGKVGTALKNIASVADHIHKYAIQRVCNPPDNKCETRFVLLGAEVAQLVSGANVHTYYKLAYGQDPATGADRLLFDFMMPPIRPIDVLPPQSTSQPMSRQIPANTDPCSNAVCNGSADGCLEERDASTPPCAGTTRPAPPIPPHMPECQNPWVMTTIDPCHSWGMMPNGGGVSPTGRLYIGESPRLAGFDKWISGFGLDCSKPPFDRGTRNPVATGANDAYTDDNGWYKNLKQECQAAWLAYHIPYMRTLSADEHTAFLQPICGSEAGYHFARDNNPSLVQNAIRAAWEPRETLTATLTVNACAEPLNMNTFTCPQGKAARRPSWNFQVSQPSAGSIYTWHIRRPDGTYEPRSYGSKLTYSPTMQGQYSIGVQEDNLGLPLTQWPSGTRFYDISASQTYVQFQCCDIPGSSPGDARPLALTPVSAEEFGRRMATEALATSADAGADFSVTVYPNPVAGALSVNLVAPQAGTVGLRVSNVLGQEVGAGAPTQPVAAGEQTLTLDTSALPQGVYLLRVTLNNVTQVKQFVKL